MVIGNLSLRAKLAISFLAVMTLTGAIAVFCGLHLIGDHIVKDMQDKVRLDLNSAREVYLGVQKDVENAVRSTSIRFFLKESLVRGGSGAIGQELTKIRQDESLDMLMVVDQKGRALLRATGASQSGESYMDNPLVRTALRERKTVSSTLIIPIDEIGKCGRGLAERACIEVVPTPMEKGVSKTETGSAMTIAAAAPIISKSGILLGALYGGKLLNRNYEIVDKADDILYRGMRYAGKHEGIVTIFQDDVRIATVLRNEDGSRVVGTRVSARVYDKVLVAGEQWIDRAFVVNDWYITAYEPIRDMTGKIIGMLGLGILEKKYMDLRREIFLIFSGVVLIGMLATAIVAFFLSGVILGPISRMMDASHRLADGDFSARVVVDSSDELGKLGETFNSMAHSIQEHEDQIKRHAQERIAGSERLAILGQLAAGVAHEINNPLGGILIYSHLLLDDTDKDDPRRMNLEKIARETARCRDIVRGLLDFARQSKLEVEDADINEVVEKTLSLVENHVLFQNVKLKMDLSSDLPLLSIDKGQIQQVLLNVVMNAVEAMGEDGGGLTIVSRMKEAEGQVEVSVRDTGPGISSVNLRRIFEPFFTTKGVGKGVGLGLAISYGILEKHGGKLAVDSEQGKGATVSLLFPVG